MASASRSDDLDLTSLRLADDVINPEDDFFYHFRVPRKPHLKSYIWTDDVAKDVSPPHSPNMLISDLIRMGDCMVVMLARGPTRRLGDLTAALALQIRDRKLRRIFPQDQFEAGILEGDVIGQTASAEVLQEIEAYVAEHHRTAKSLKKGCRPQFFLDLRCAEGFYFRYPHLNKPDWDDTLRFFSHFESVRDEVKAAFYCFVAAMLVRCCVKSPETVKKNLENVEERFSFLVTRAAQGLFLPTPTNRCLEVLVRYFKPGEKTLRQVLKVFLLHRYYSEPIDPAAREILDFTLLKHCKYNGMQMIALTEMASDIEGVSYDRLRELYHTIEADKSWPKICKYFETYSDANDPAYPGYLAPWSRLFHNEFWSNLHIKHHSTLGHILMGACECRNPNIWQMKGIRVNETSKAIVQSVMEAHGKDKARK